MRETNGLRHHRTIARSATILACASAASLLWACSDDTTTPGTDAGGDVSVADSSADAAKDSAATDSAMDAGAMDATTSDAKDSTAPDSTTNDATTKDAPTTDSPSEAAPPADAPSDSNSGDSATTSDAAADASDAAPPQPLALCVTLDNACGLTNDGGACPNYSNSAGACPDREDNWADPIVQTAILAAQNDCRIQNSVYPASFLADSQAVTDYLNFLNLWVLELMGCPELGSDAGAGQYGLIPVPQQSNFFTTADTDALSSYIVTAINPTIDLYGGTDLTQAQLDTVTAELQRRALTLPHIRSSALFSDPSACPPPDAGSDASDAGASDSGSAGD